MRGLLISDLHVDSYFGLIPLKCKIDGMKIQPNREQTILQKEWSKMCSKEKGLDFCLINGDICDGYQKAEQGKYVITSDLRTQAEHAVELISMIDAKKFFLTKGTEYHAMNDRPLEQYVADLLKERGIIVSYRPEQSIAADWCRIHALHHIPVSMSTWQYRTTPLARDALLYELHEDVYGHYNLIVRSHAHYYVGVDFGHRAAVITPAWQTRTPFAVKKDIVAPTTLGYLTLELTEKPEFVIHKHFFTLPGPILTDEVV